MGRDSRGHLGELSHCLLGNNCSIALVFSVAISCFAELEHVVDPFTI